MTTNSSNLTYDFVINCARKLASTQKNASSGLLLLNAMAETARKYTGTVPDSIAKMSTRVCELASMRKKIPEMDEGYAIQSASSDVMDAQQTERILSDLLSTFTRIANDPVQKVGLGFSSNDARTDELLTVNRKKMALSEFINMHVRKFMSDPGKRMFTSKFRNMNNNNYSDVVEQLLSAVKSKWQFLDNVSGATTLTMTAFTRLALAYCKMRGYMVSGRVKSSENNNLAPASFIVIPSESRSGAFERKLESFVGNDKEKMSKTREAAMEALKNAANGSRVTIRESDKVYSLSLITNSASTMFMGEKAPNVMLSPSEIKTSLMISFASEIEEHLNKKTLALDAKNNRGRSLSPKEQGNRSRSVSPNLTTQANGSRSTSSNPKSQRNGAVSSMGTQRDVLRSGPGSRNTSPNGANRASSTNKQQRGPY